MFLALPFTTDAPLYHRPIGTVLMMLVNTAIYAVIFHDAQFGGGALRIEPFYLEHGRIVPLQWITSNFIHASWEHVLGNVLFLWIFGHVVEGKIGLLRFLGVYFLIGAIECAAEQVLSLGLMQFPPQSYSCGASAIVAGLMAICLIWAPENTIAFITFRRGWRGDQADDSEVRISVVAMMYIGVELVIVFVTQGAPSSALYHLMGVVPGLAIAHSMLWRGTVDCEGWDLYNVLRGRHLERGPDLETMQDAAKRDRARAAAAHSHIRDLLSTGKALDALRLHLRMKARVTAWKLPEKELADLIQGLLREGHLDEVGPLVSQYAESHPTQADAMWLAMAEALVGVRRLAEARLLLIKIEPGTLPEALEDRRARLLAVVDLAREDAELRVMPENDR